MPSGLPALGRRVVTYDAANPDPPCSVLATLVETRHVYAGIEVVAEYAIVAGLAPTAGLGGASAPPQALPAGWDLAREFLWGERFPEPLAMIDFTDAGSRPRPGVTTGGAETLYYHHDALGSVVALTDAGDPEASPDPIPGKIVERYTYDPYGKTVIESWNGSAFAVENASHFGNPFAWTAQRYDAGVGLYHFLFRSYSPEFGRWLQRDPAGYVDGPNLLEYVRSMPTGLVDPLGLDGDGAEPKQPKPCNGKMKGKKANAQPATPRSVPKVRPPPGEKDFKWKNQNWTWRTSEGHNQHEGHYDSDHHRLYEDGTIEDKRLGKKSRKPLSLTDLKKLRKLGVKLGIVAALLAAPQQEAVAALEEFAKEDTPCGKWYAAGLQNDYETQERLAQACYDQLIDAGLAHAALHFNGWAADLAAKRAAERARAEEAQRARKAKEAEQGRTGGTAKPKESED